MEKKTVDALNTLDGSLKGTYYPLQGMTKADEQKLIDDHFLFKNNDRCVRKAMYDIATQCYVFSLFFAVVGTTTYLGHFFMEQTILTHTYVYVYMYVCIYICICIIYIHNVQIV